jgi:hypothetical protein
MLVKIMTNFEFFNKSSGQSYAEGIDGVYSIKKKRVLQERIPLARPSTLNSLLIDLKAGLSRVLE